MKLTVLFFAAAKDAVGSSSATIEISGQPTPRELRRELVAHFPALESIAAHLLIAVNQQFAADDFELRDTDEIACFPPVSGG